MNWSGMRALAGRRSPVATPRRGGPGCRGCGGFSEGSPRYEVRGSVRSGVLVVGFHGVAVALPGQYGSWGIAGHGNLLGTRHVTWA